MASAVLKAAGFSGEGLKIALAVSWFESWSNVAKRGGFSDAVGDIPLVNEKWGPSVGLFQIRSLHHPGQYPRPDNLRYADKLRDVQYNAAAAFAISKGGTDWSKWSVFTSGKYSSRLGVDYDVRTGHENADKWNTKPTPPAGPTCVNPVFTTTVPRGDGSNWTDPQRPNWVVNNEVWNAEEAGPQTLSVCSASSWKVVSTQPDPENPDADRGSIKSYPCTQVLFPNTPVGTLKTIKSSWAHECPQLGEWNATFDIWLQGWNREVMIWTEHRYGGDTPAPLPPGNATEKTTVTIDGKEFIAWRRPMDGDWYIALVMKTKTPTGSLDLKKVFDWLVSKNWIQPENTLQAVNYGIEIADTLWKPEGFYLNHYTLEHT